MRTIIMGGVLMLAAAAFAQQLSSPASTPDNPQLFVQPEEPPLPQKAQPAETRATVPVQQQQQQNAAVEEQPNERENVVGRDETETDQEQHLFDQWNAPAQGKGGTASVRIVR